MRPNGTQAFRPEYSQQAVALALMAAKRLSNQRRLEDKEAKEREIKTRGPTEEKRKPFKPRFLTEEDVKLYKDFCRDYATPNQYARALPSNFANKDNFWSLCPSVKSWAKEEEEPCLDPVTDEPIDPKRLITFRFRTSPTESKFLCRDAVDLYKWYIQKKSERPAEAKGQQQEDWFLDPYLRVPYDARALAALERHPSLATHANEIRRTLEELAESKVLEAKERSSQNALAALKLAREQEEENLPPPMPQQQPSPQYYTPMSQQAPQLSLQQLIDAIEQKRSELHQIDTMVREAGDLLNTMTNRRSNSAHAIEDQLRQYISQGNALYLQLQILEAQLANLVH